MGRYFLINAIIILACGICLAAGPHGTQFGQPLTEGGIVALTDDVAQALAETGAGFVRLNIRLANVAPYNDDTAEWYAVYDAIIDRLRSRGLEVIGLLTNEARPWAPPSEWQANNKEVAGGNGWNSYLDSWCSAFIRYATHWQGKIKYWELWNEPDCLSTLYPSNFAALLANAYDRARTANLPIEIISGGLCANGCSDPNQGPGYLSKVYNMGINQTGWFTWIYNKWGTYPMDHIGFHIYPANQWGLLDQTALSNYFECFWNTVRTYEGANTSKKLWLTEFGWSTANCTETQQAQNLSNAFSIIRSKPYILHANWFYLQDNGLGLNYGVFRAGGLTDSFKKPAWSNLKTNLTYEGRWSAGGTINQPILDYFNAKGHIAMGNPYDNGGSAWVHNWDYGPVQDFKGGSLGRMTVFDAPTGTGVSVRGAFWEAIVSGTNHPDLEFPLEDQFYTGVFYKQLFEGGYMTWSESSGLTVVRYANKVAIDNSDPGFTASTGWSTFTVSDGFKDGKCRRRYGTSSNTDPATWTFSISSSGNYDVYARWPTVSNAATTAIYRITHSGGTAQVTVNQSTRTGRWNKLGSFHFNAGNATIQLSSQGATDKYLLADAVRMIGPGTTLPDATPPTVPVVNDEGVYTSNASQLSASWESVDNESGINRYEYAVGTSPTDPGSGYLIPWTSNGINKSITVTASFVQGTTYYFYVRAWNNAGLSSVGVSDGITVDSTPPTRPTIIDDGDYTGETTLLHAKWTASDPESGIAGYIFAVGSTAGGSDVVPETEIGPTGEVWVTGLNLIPGKTYYFKAKARNGAGLLSTSWANSNGIRVEAISLKDSIAQALELPNSTKVMLKSKIISAVFGDRFYIVDANRVRGIAVIGSYSYPEGTIVDVTGALQISSGERRIVPGAVTPKQ